MTHLPKHKGLAAALVTGSVALAIAGCAETVVEPGGPLEYTQQDEMLDAPGIFSGSTEGMKLFSSEDGLFSRGRDESNESSYDSSASPPDVSYQEFEAFKRFQEAKQQGSEAAGDEGYSEEYKEFLQWKEWQEYREWKRNQGTVQ